MKKIILSVSALFLAVFLHAQGLENIIVEKYYIATAADSAGSVGNLPIGSVTYRFYVDMLPQYKFQAAFGNANHELRFATSTSFFNNEDYGNTVPNGISVNNSKKNTVLLDSWISVGAAAAGKVGVLKTEDTDGSIGNINGLYTNSDISIGNVFTVKDGMVSGTPQAVTSVGISSALSVFDATSGSGNLFTTNNGAWSALNGARGATSSNRVLIAQITTNGTLDYKLNIQIKDTTTNVVEKWVTSNPQTGELVLASLHGTLHPATIYGYVIYNNIVNTPMGTVSVFLKQGTTVIKETTSNAQGAFYFNSVADGSYDLDGSTTKTAGGYNSADAFLASKHFVGLSILTGINKDAADVNNSGTINSTDALLIQRRFVGQVSTFAAGDWVFDKTPFTVSGSNVTHNLKALCFGDINASYVPATKQAPQLSLELKGNLTVNPGQLIEIPIRIDRNLAIGAVSLKMDIPQNLEVVAVDMLDNQNLVYNTDNNELKISWFNIASKNLNKDDVLMKIVARIKSESFQNDFSIADGSEIDDFNGNVVESVRLNIPKLMSATKVSGLTLSSFPNPATSNTTFNVNVPADGIVTVKIYNLSGEIVAMPFNSQLSNGNHSLNFDLTKIKPGSYFYVAEMSGFTPCNGKLIILNQ